MPKAESAPASATAWVEGLSPWPEEFGLERMEALLEALGDPQAGFTAIHVVGTNAKSSTTRLTAQLLEHAGLATGSYISPHVRGWSERIQLRGRDADFEAAVRAVRGPAEQLGATQFEVLTAAAFRVFADAGVDVAAVEAGLGGRLDATNVLDAPVVVLTNVALDHTEVLGDTREAIAREKLAVVRPGATVVLGEQEWELLARELGAGVIVAAGPDAAGLARGAAGAYLGRDLDAWQPALDLPGRLEVRGRSPLEIRDGAHNPAGAAHLARQLAGPGDAVLVVALMADKDAQALLRALAPLGRRLLATSASNPRALPAERLAEVARRHFAEVEAVPEPAAALARARELAGPEGAVVVTGSLYLLADLHSVT